jgi:hypothetical protein
LSLRTVEENNRRIIIFVVWCGCRRKCSAVV